jgi:hypothetical protein
MTQIRRHLRREVGLARDDVSLTPYWRHAAHPEEPEDDDEPDGDAETVDAGVDSASG